MQYVRQMIIRLIKNTFRGQYIYLICYFKNYILNCEQLSKILLNNRGCKKPCKLWKTAKVDLIGGSNQGS